MTLSWHDFLSRYFPPLIQRLGWITITATLVALVAGVRASISPPAALIDLGPAQALTTPSFWFANGGIRAIVWKPAGTDTGLVLQALDGSTVAAILAYPDVRPQTWHVAPANRDTFHLVWIESDGRLQSALIHADGSTIRGPVELSLSSGQDFAIVPQAGGAAAVLWTNTQSRQIASVRLDPSGRPGPIRINPATQSEQMAAAYDEQETLRVAWLALTEPQTRTIFVASISPDLSMNNPLSIGTLSLRPEEVISSFEFGLTTTHLVLAVGIVNAEQPDVEHVSLFSTALDAPQPTNPIQLQLPAGCPSVNDAPVYTDPASTMPSSMAADLRWPQLLPGQPEQLVMVVACRTAKGWHPVMVKFDSTSPITYRQIAAEPLDAARPALAEDAAGKISLAWLSLDHARPHLMVIPPDQNSGTQGIKHHSSIGIAALLRGLLAGVAIGWLWLLIPAILLHFFPHNPWTTPMALMVFGAAQLLWPGELFSTVPLIVETLGFDGGSPGLAVSAAILLCGGFASGVMALAHTAGISVRIQWLVFGLADTLLLWALFGSNLV